MTGLPAGEYGEHDTVKRLFEQAVRDYAQNRLIISEADDSVFTYADAEAIVRRIASRLCAEGVGAGDRICTVSRDNAEMFLLFWATASIGAVFVPLGPEWPDRVLARVLEQAAPRIVLCDRTAFDQRQEVVQRYRVLLFDGAGAEEPCLPPALADWLEGAPEGVPDRRVAAGDDALIIYTSGSAGEPKGVVLSQGALCRRGRQLVAAWECTPQDVLLSPGPLYGLGGFRNPAIVMLAAGACFVLPSPESRKDLFALLACIPRHHCTCIVTTPSLARQAVRFRDRVAAESLSSLRLVLTTGSMQDRTLAEEFTRAFRVPLLDCYGMTETTGACISMTPQNYRQAAGSIGSPVGCDVQIVDTEDRPVADGADGELCVRGDSLMTGYYQDPELTNRTMRGGWLHTGDLARKRPDGFFELRGRLRNIIKNAHTEAVSFEEVELALERHPLVHEAAVCSFISTRGDEQLAAFVVPTAAGAVSDNLIHELKLHLRQEVGATKVPAVVALKGSLPRSGSGKVMREALKKELAGTDVAGSRYSPRAPRSPGAERSMPAHLDQQLAAQRAGRKMFQGLLNGYRNTSLLYLAARLGIAELLSDGPRSSDDLAQELNVHAPALLRILRGLVVLGVCEARSGGHFSLTAFGTYLRKDHPESLYNMTLLAGEEGVGAWGGLLHSVRTGETAFDKAFGMNQWEYHERHPELAALFNGWLRAGTVQLSRAVLDAYDFSPFTTVMDVGGGQGAFLAALLHRYPAACGILFDQEEAVAEARAYLGAEGVGDRCRFAAGSFFEALPSGADVLVLKNILHNWDDDRCVALLNICSRAMNPAARVLVLEHVLPAFAVNDPDMVMMDIEMLALVGGRERTEAEFRGLAEQAGLAMARMIPTGSKLSIIELLHRDGHFCRGGQ